LRIVKTVAFDAAHYLDDCPEGRPYARMHGHSFTIEAAIEGEPDPKTGWIEDFAAAAAALDEVKSRLDHRLLNEVEGLGRPTLENICRYAAKHLKRRLPGLVQVRVARPSVGEACVYDVEP
jgi:6-pyruvoyltetrahydropterin/6-carboxytetrahydropterin synthase